jgi:cytochrome P450
MGLRRTIFINDPDLIKDVLVTKAASFYKGRGLEKAKKVLGTGLLTSEGELHVTQRRLIQPAFHKERISAYGTIATVAALNLDNEWRNGITVDITQEMFRLTLGIVGRTLFGSEIEQDAAEISAVWEDLIASFNWTMMPFGAAWDYVPTPASMRYRNARKRLDDLVYNLIKQHEEAKEKKSDLLTMLIEARDDQNGNVQMTTKQLRDEALTIMMAGHETTANALAWTWVLLSQHPDVLAKLHREISFILGDRLPTFDDIAKLTYTRQVISESIRLFPPAWAIGRKAVADVDLGGYKVPKGTLVLMSPAVTQRDPRWFRDPHLFNPDRWEAGKEEERPKFAYFPFGGGPRTCIGEQFAWMELILLVTAISQRWIITLAPDAVVKMDPVITLRPKPGLWMSLESRITKTSPRYVNLG